MVVLHDFVLHHLVAGMTAGRGDAEGYRRALFREQGVVGRLLAHAVLDGLIAPLWETRPDEFPLTLEVLQFATGVIVHSAYVERRVREIGFDGPVWRVSHPAWSPPAALRNAALPAGTPVVGCFGNLTPAKRVPQLVEAFGRLRERFPEALLVLGGDPGPAPGLDAAIERTRLRVGTDVVRLPYVEEGHLWAALDACDVCVNLRSPTMGETSGIAIRALVLATPLVVSDVGWFAELPDSAVAKVPTDEWEVPTLAETLELLAGDARLRAKMAEAGRDYVRREHSLERCAELYAAALEEAAGKPLVREAVLREVAAAAAEVGLDAGSPELADVGTALREVGLGD